MAVTLSLVGQTNRGDFQVPWMVIPVIFMPPTNINKDLMAWMVPLSQVAAVLADGRQPFAVGMAVIAHGGRLMGGCS